jgi:hypothetical protein
MLLHLRMKGLPAELNVSSSRGSQRSIISGGRRRLTKTGPGLRGLECLQLLDGHGDSEAFRRRDQVVVVLGVFT